MNQPIRLGPFVVTRPLGQGGMGAVWHARHPEGVDVALKVLKPAFVTSRSALDAFREEVRSVAALDHPHVVRVFDFGFVPAATAALAGDVLPEGAPWLAMACATHGTLGDLKQVATWSELSTILRQILDALAHSHAHQIVHRDLKPRNILVFRGDALRIALTDFGLAHALSRGMSGHAQAGTPGYMAPEQIRGEWRTLGPWTDLYALGCVLWRLCTGRPPFHRSTKVQVVRAHLLESPPPLAAGFELPPGLEAWGRTLLAKDPSDRFVSAADAIAAFDEVEHGRGPRVFPSWRPSHPTSPQRPIGTGLAMFLLRPWPLVGRELVQDRLWSLLRQVSDTGRSALVVVEAEPGLGKSRLLDWLAQRSREVGAAETLTLRGPGLRDQLRAALRVTDADADETAQVLQAWLRRTGSPDPVSDRASLEAALSRVGEPWGWPELFDRLTHERPLVLVVDDLHLADSPVLQLVSGLSHSTRPILVVVATTSTAALPPPIAAVLANATTLRLPPLSAGDQRRLLDAGGAVSPSLARRVIDRTGGHPGLSVRLVSEWARTGALVPTSSGYDLRADRGDGLPDRVRRWIEERLAPLAPAELEALELLALLGGSRVREVDWTACSRELGASLDLDRLRGTGLVEAVEVRGGTRWTLETGVLRDALLERASGTARAHRMHLACATVLASQGRAASTERAVVHFLAAERPQDALVALRKLADEAVHHDQDGRLAAFLEQEEGVLRLLAPEPQDPRRLRHRLDRHTLHHRTGEGHPDPAAIRMATSAEDGETRAAAVRAIVRSAPPADPDDPEWRRLLALADTHPRTRRAVRWARARCLGASGRAPAAVDELDHALAELAAGEPDGPDLRRLVRERWRWAAMADAPELEATLARACAELAEVEPATTAALLVWRARWHRRRSDRVRAQELLDEARPILAAVGASTVAADLQSALSRLATGAHTSARGVFEAALEAQDPDPESRALARAGALACAAAARDWRRWDTLAAHPDVRRSDPDVAWCLEWAAARCEAFREPARAAAARRWVSPTRDRRGP